MELTKEQEDTIIKEAGEIDKQQADYLKKNGKYLRIKPYEIDGVTIRVDEYFKPSEPEVKGYWVSKSIVKDGDTYIKVGGTGIDTKTVDWVKYVKEEEEALK